MLIFLQGFINTDELITSQVQESDTARKDEQSDNWMGYTQIAWKTKLI